MAAAILKAKFLFYKWSFGWAVPLFHEFDRFLILLCRWVWWPVLPLIIVVFLVLDYAFVFLWALIPLIDTVGQAWPLFRVFQEMNRRMVRELVAKGKLEANELDKLSATPAKLSRR